MDQNATVKKFLNSSRKLKQKKLTMILIWQLRARLEYYSKKSSPANRAKREIKKENFSSYSQFFSIGEGKRVKLILIMAKIIKPFSKTGQSVRRLRKDIKVILYQDRAILRPLFW